MVFCVCVCVVSFLFLVPFLKGVNFFYFFFRLLLLFFFFQLFRNAYGIIDDVLWTPPTHITGDINERNTAFVSYF